MKFTFPFAIVATALGQVAVQGSPPSHGDVKKGNNKTKRLPNPLHEKAVKNRLTAIEKKIQGQRGPQNAGSGDKIEKVAKGQFVQLAVEGTDNVWTLLGEFKDIQHNEIPEPDPRDNAVYWKPDFNAAYYQEYLFSDTVGASSLTNYFLEQSGGRYKVFGTVEDWVGLPDNMAVYGNNECGDTACRNVWDFVCGTAKAWYDSKISSGMSQQAITDYLAQFDVWDRYDYNGDGNFDEPDGYIDHAQFVHAFTGEEASRSANEIWSHRWYVSYDLYGDAGPSGYASFGGCEVGHSGIWIGDYTIHPENGGLGVFTHEYGHDLGLPDLYDYSGENSVGFWDLYGSGSWLGNGVDDIGTAPGPMNSWEKLVLGWLDYTVVGYGERKTVRLGPLTSNSKQIQAAMVLLPEQKIFIQAPEPKSGKYVYFSGSGNDLRNSMAIQVAIPPGGATLTAKVWYDIEEGWDYAYVRINGTPIQTSLSSADDPKGQNFGGGITGSSGGVWWDLEADLSAVAGQIVEISFFYWTDGAASNPGIFVDDIAIDGGVLADNAETEGTPSWTFGGFTRRDTSAGGFFENFSNYYLAEYRTYRGSDKNTQVGPYSYYSPCPAENYCRVEHFPYQDGLLVWYRDLSFPDNDVTDHCDAGRCGGMLLPVDAHPDLFLNKGGTKIVRPKIQSFDSTFSLDNVDKVCLDHYPGGNVCFGGTKGVAIFDDTKDYWNPPDPSISNFGQVGVAVPKTGTTIRVINTNAQGNFMQIQVNGLKRRLV